MENKKNLEKQIIYRSTHRGTKEMDILLGNFVNKYIGTFDDNDLNDLNHLLNYEDEILRKWYFDKVEDKSIPSNKITKMLKDYKI